jgi:hypothetical protein
MKQKYKAYIMPGSGKHLSRVNYFPKTRYRVFCFSVFASHHRLLLRDVYNCQSNVDCDAEGQPTSILMFPNVVRKELSEGASMFDARRRI